MQSHVSCQLALRNSTNLHNARAPYSPGVKSHSLGTECLWPGSICRLHGSARQVLRGIKTFLGSCNWLRIHTERIDSTNTGAAAGLTACTSKVFYDLRSTQDIDATVRAEKRIDKKHVEQGRCGSAVESGRLRLDTKWRDSGVRRCPARAVACVEVETGDSLWHL